MIIVWILFSHFEIILKGPIGDKVHKNSSLLKTEFETKCTSQNIGLTISMATSAVWNIKHSDLLISTFKSVFLQPCYSKKVDKNKKHCDLCPSMFYREDQDTFVSYFQVFLICSLAYRMTWEKDMKDYLKKLEETKPVIFCGDFNVAHTEIGNESIS